MKIAVANQKGGVGKTTTALNLAKGLSLKGFKTLLIDNDPQGNLTSVFVDSSNGFNAYTMDLYDGQKVEPHKLTENLFLYGADKRLSRVPERGMDAVYGLKEGLVPIENDFDYIIIDCLPGLENLLLASLAAADKVLIPFKPAPFPIQGLGDLFDTIEKAQKRLNPYLTILGIVFNLVDSHTIVMEREIMDSIREEREEYIFKTQLMKRVKVEEASAFNKTIFEYDKDFSLKNYQSFVNEFIQVTGGRK